MPTRHISSRSTTDLRRSLGLTPRFDPIPQHGSLVAHLPVEVRPLYWWVRDLWERGYVLRGMAFTGTTAVVALQSPSYRVITVRRSARDAERRLTNAAEVLAEAVLQLGSAAWTHELSALIHLLRETDLLQPALPARPRIAEIAGLDPQPPTAVRTAYWWAEALMERGWRLHEIGGKVALGGFVAEIAEPGSVVFAVYPGGMDPDGSDAGALAEYLQWLTPRQLACLRELVGSTSALRLERTRHR